jgi:hypothetical protein
MIIMSSSVRNESNQKSGIAYIKLRDKEKRTLRTQCHVKVKAVERVKELVIQSQLKVKE